MRTLLRMSFVLVVCTLMASAPAAGQEIETPPDKGVVVKTHVIAGNVALKGVTMKGLPGSPKTGPDGSYHAIVPHGWSGTVVPVMEGYTFDPAQRAYRNLAEDSSNDTYTYKVLQYRISGSVGAPGVMMQGLPGDPITDATGCFTAEVPYGWRGEVMPTKEGYAFNPPRRTYEKVTADQKNETFTATVLTYTISGHVGVPGVTMQGFPNHPVSDAGGITLFRSRTVGPAG